MSSPFSVFIVMVCLSYDDSYVSIVFNSSSDSDTYAPFTISPSFSAIDAIAPFQLSEKPPKISS